MLLVLTKYADYGLEAQIKADLGTLSTTIGTIDTVEHDYALFGAAAAGGGSLALGLGAVAHDLSLAFGSGCTAGSVGFGNAAAVGINANAAASGALAFGNQAFALGKGGTSLGNFASGQSDVAIGLLAACSGRGNVCIGTDDPDAVGSTPAAIPVGWNDTVQLGRGEATLQGGLNFRGKPVMNSTGSLVISNAVFMITTVSLTNGAAAQIGTITNAPVAGNPTKWIPINDNGTTRYIPAW